MNKSYFCITGCSKIKDVDFCCTCFDKYNLLDNDFYMPSIALLMNHKLFEAKTNYPNNKRNVTIEKSFKLLDRINKGKILRAIHYHTHNKNFSNEIINILNSQGRGGSYYEDRFLYELVDLIQLNIATPNPIEFKRIKKQFPDIAIILQFNNSITKNIKVLEISDLRRKYYKVIDYLLFDLSEGRGINIDYSNDNIKNVIRTLFNLFENKNIGLAGGFSGDNIIQRLKDFKNEFKNEMASIDAEGRLRNDEDDLDYHKVNLYVKNFSTFLKEMI